MNYLFANPGALFGLVAIAVPIAIHLLLRRKPIVEHWGATRFLKKVVERKRAQLHVHSYTQLLVRMAILALIVFAIADPRIDALGSSNEKKQDIHRLLIVDVSMSMGATEAGESRLDEVKRQIASLISQSSSGDSWQLLLHGSSDNPTRFRVPLYESTLVKDEILKLAPTGRGAEIVETLRQAKSLIDEFPGSRNEILFWTDLAANDWNRGGSTEYEINTYLEQLSQAAQLSLIDVGKKSLSNVSNTDLKLLSEHVVVGDRVRFEATIKNYSTLPTTTPVTLWIRNEPITEQEISLKPFETKSIDFEVTVTHAGLNACRTEIQDDSLTADNTRHFAFYVNDTVDVLVVEKELDFDSLRQSDFLDLAFTSSQAVHSGSIISTAPRYRVTNLTPEMFQRTTLNQFDVLIVCGLPEVTEFDAKRIHDFVTAGGGLLISMSDEISFTNYNEMFGPQRNDLLPATLLRKVTIPEFAAEPFRIGRLNADLPLLRPFEQHPASGLQTTRIYSYVETESKSSLSSQSETVQQNVVQLENGSPLILASDRGLGKVFLITTSFNTEWGSWVLWPSFLPMIQRMTDELTDKNSRISMSVIGQTDFDNLVDFNRPVSIEKSDRQSIDRLELSVSDSIDNLEAALHASGLYTFSDVELEKPVHWVVRNVDVTEGDLRHFQLQSLSASGPFKGVKLAVTEEPPQFVVSRSGIGFSDESRFARWLLSLAIFFLIVDQLFPILPAAAYGALVGAMLSGWLTYISELPPSEDFLLIVACIALCIYIAYLFSERAAADPQVWGRPNRL